MNDLPPTSSGPRADIRAMKIFFNAIIAGIVMFSLIVLALSFMTQIISPVKEYEEIIAGILIVIGLVCFAVARNSYQKGVSLAKESLISLPDKLNQYRSSLIRYMALCDGPALLGIIFFYVTGNYLMFIVTAIMLAAMLAKAPNRQRVIDELSLDWQQQQQLD